MASGEIDPGLIEWSSRQYESGRPASITVTFPSRRRGLVAATFRAKSDDAGAAIADLETHAHPDLLSSASLFLILLDITKQRSQGKRPYVRIADGVKVSATPEGARTLLDDLRFWAPARDPKDRTKLITSPSVIRNSAVGRALRVAADANLTRWKVTRQAIDALLRGEDGPSISAFAKRLNGRQVSADDVSLRDAILEAAESAGYERAQFFRRDNPGVLLLWPLQAFMIEYSLGGAHWWTKANLIPPMVLMRQEMRRSRGSAETGKRTIYRHYLGDDWREIIERQPKPGHLPRRIRRLLPRQALAV